MSFIQVCLKVQNKTRILPGYNICRVFEDTPELTLSCWSHGLFHPRSVNDRFSLCNGCRKPIKVSEGFKTIPTKVLNLNLNYHCLVKLHVVKGAYMISTVTEMYAVLPFALISLRHL